MRSKFKWIFTLLVAFTVQFSFAQEKTVKGIVTDASGSMPGVNVTVKGTQRGVSSGFDGSYAIKASEGETLVFSFMGMNDISRLVGTSSVISVKMQDDTKLLGEVVIQGALGVKKKKSEFTSSQQVVGVKELQAASNPNIIRSLAGKVSGVQINSTSQGVGGKTSIKIRGGKSIYGSSEALIVIDNVFSSAELLAAMPSEFVDNVTILKGAQGAALYGEQGSNGVVLVTTKKGSKTDKFSFNVSSGVDFETISFVPKRQMKYGQGWYGAYDPVENGGWGEPFDGSIRDVGMPQADGNIIQAPYSPIKDNIKQFYKDGAIYQNSVGFNAGGENGYAIFNASNLQRDFIVKGDNLKRSSFMFKGGKTFKDKWNVDGAFTYVTGRTKQSDTGTTLLELLNSAGNIPIGQFDNNNPYGGWTVYYSNPFWRRDNNRLQLNSDLFNINSSLGYSLNKHIDARYTGSVQFKNDKQQTYRNGYVDDGSVTAPYGANVSQTATFHQSNFFSRYFYGDFIVNFAYDLTDSLKFKANLGQNTQINYNNRISQGGSNFSTLGWYNIQNVLNPDLPKNLDNRSFTGRKLSEFVNLDFNFKDYLFLNLTSRFEHTSKLKPSLNDTFYPSAGMSFVPTKIGTWSENSKVNYLKIFANATKVGSTDAVNDFAIYDTQTIATGYPFPNAGYGNSFNNFVTLTDPNLKPEYYTTFEAGINLSMFNDRLTIDAAGYSSKTTDLITNSSQSNSTGFTNYVSNSGDIETKGFEVDLGFTPVRTTNFTWNARASFTTSKNKVIRLNGGADQVTIYDISGNTNISAAIVAQVGQSFPLLTGTDWVRDPEGNVIIDATTGLPSADNNFKVLGKVTPDYILGYTNTLTYKGLGLAFTLDYRTGHKVISETKYNSTWNGHLVESADFDRYVGFIFPNSVIETSPGVYTANTSVLTGGDDLGGLNPNGTTSYYGTVSQLGAHNAIDATALKVREIALSYSLPSKLTDKLGIQSFKFSVNARNPFVILAKDNRGYTDPESDNVYDGSNANSAQRATTANNTARNGQGFSQTGQYPSTKTIGFSINVGF